MEIQKVEVTFSIKFQSEDATEEAKHPFLAIFWSHGSRLVLSLIHISEPTRPY